MGVSTYGETDSLTGIRLEIDNTSHVKQPVLSDEPRATLSRADAIVQRALKHADVRQKSLLAKK